MTTYFAYSGKTKTTTLPSGQSTTKTVDDFGKLVSVSDPGGSISYDYFSHGQIKSIDAPGANFSMTYDANGFQKTLTDPDAGAFSYDYNSIGQLNSQTSPIGTSTMTYDNLGRIVTENKLGDTYTYFYVESGNGIGQLDRIVKNSKEIENYDYDNFGRLTSFTEWVGDIYLTTEYEYDINGRLSMEKYPENFGVIYLYDSIGTLTEIRTSENALVWKLESINSDGQIDRYSYGNGLSTSLSYNSSTKSISGIATGSIQNLTYNFNASKGHLTSRTGMLSGIQETFSYDGQNQLLETTSLMTELNQTTHYNYGIPGNIARKSDVGDYFYGEDAGPHALTTVETTEGIPLNTTTQDITYTPFNKVKNISEGAFSIDFTYGTSNHRTTMVVKQGGSLKRKVYYAGNYERHIEGSVTRHVYYISSPTGLAAIYKKEASGGEMFFVHNDHLGSIHTITGQDQTVKAKYYYDAWGMQKELNLSGTVFSSTSNLAWLHRGYTGHEHIEEVDLINMNGRVYDPVLGRFLSPDPYVQAPEMSINFNRYAYCLNNPLIYTDPTGEIFGLIWAVNRAVKSADRKVSYVKGTINQIEGIGEALRNGAINPHLSKEQRQEAWVHADPTINYKQLINSYKIDAGMFMHIPGYESKQALLGNTYSHWRNMTGNVTNVEIGPNYVLVNDRNDDRWGLTLGVYINSGGIRDDYKHDPLFIHEFGHTIQSKLLGPLYIKKVGIPSALSGYLDYYTDIDHDHDRAWFEINANQFSSLFYDNGLPANDAEYPRQFKSLDWWFLLFNPFIF